MKKKICFIVIMGSLLFNCSSNTYFELEDQEVTTSEGLVTYNSHIEQIITNNCITCHSLGNSADFRPYGNYSLVKEAVLNTDLLDRIQRQNGEPGLMPQTGRMSQSQINIILQWVEDGLLEF